MKVILVLQRADEELIPIFNYLENDVLPSEEKQARKLVLEGSNFEVIEGSSILRQSCISWLLADCCPQKLETYFVERKPWRKIRWSLFRAEDLCNLANQVLVERDA